MAGKIWNRGLPSPMERKGQIRVLPRFSWDGDAIAEQVESDSLRTSWEEHTEGDILLIESAVGKSEYTHAKIFGTEWVLSFEWVVLFRFENYQECILQAELNTFYAMPAADPGEGNAKHTAIAAWLAESGWVVLSFEGY